MPFLPNKVPYRIPVFDGGLNTKWTDVSAPEHMSPDLKQVEFTDVGAVSLAKGYVKLNATRLGSYPVRGLHDYYNATTGTEELLAVCNGTVYKVSTGATAFGVVTGGTSAFNPARDVCARTVEDEAYMTSGYDTPMRYNGTGVYRVNPGTAVSQCAVGVGAGAYSLTTGGAYSYMLSGVDENGFEGAPALVSTATTVPEGYTRLNLTELYVWPASANVQTKYLYRNTAGASNLWYRVTALTANATAYVDGNSDSSIVTLYDPTNAAPPQCKWWWYHRGRMFAAGDPSNPMRMYYSKVGSPAAWPATNFLDIGKGDGYPITGLRVIGNSVALFKGTPDGSEASIWMVYMPDSTDATDASNWYIVKAPSSNAAMGDKGVAFLDNMLAFIDKSGMFVYNGEAIQPAPSVAQAGQYLATSRSENIDPDVGDWKTTILKDAAMVSFNDKLWLAVPGSSTSIQNDSIYTYDFSVTTKERGDGAWSKLNPLGINNFAIFGGQLVGGSSTDGYIYELDKGYTADGSNLDTYFYTMTLAGDKKHWDMTKIWRYLWMTVDTPGSWNLNVTWWVDGSDSQTGSEAISLTGTGAEWESAHFDSSTWDSGKSRRTIRVGLAGCVGRTIQFKFSTNSQNVWWALYRMELEYNLRSRRS
jgi:hypothetical protein